MPRNLVVTGASTGIGRAIAVAAHEAGWRVLGTVRKDADVDALAQLGIASARLDLQDDASVIAGCEEIVGWCAGELHGLINNAGSTWPAPIELMALADLRAQLDLNVVGQVHITQRLLPSIRSAGGHVLFISSDSTVVTPPIVGAYAASKRAIEAIAESLAIETLDQGIRVSVLSPGPYDTAIWGTSTPRGEAYLSAPDPRMTRYQALAEGLRRMTTKRTLHDPRDLAQVALGLLDHAAPPFRTTAPLQSRITSGIRRWIPSRLWFRVLRWLLLRGGEG